MKLKPLSFPLLAEEVSIACFWNASGFKQLGAPTRNNNFVESLLRELMARVDELLSTVEVIEDLHLCTGMHRLCAFVVQIVHVLRVTPLVQMMPILSDFDLGQRRWNNRLLHEISDRPECAMMQVSLNLEYGDIGFLHSRVFAIQAYVKSNADTAHFVSKLPGQPSVAKTTADIPLMLTSLYKDFEVTPTEELLVLSLLKNS